MEIINPARRRLEQGGLAIGVGARQARTVDTAVMMASLGYDWLFIDLEHGSLSLDTAAQLSVACNAAGISPIVRVPKGQYDMATRALDSGAMGIIIPHVDTADEAREAVDRLKFPPAGHRSAGGPMAQARFAGAPLAIAAKVFNAAMLIVPMIETPLAVKNAETIAATPGVDALLIGTNDLTLEMGIPGEIMHKDVHSAYESVIAAAKKHEKWAAVGGVYTPEGLKHYIGMGCRMALAGSDYSFLMAAAGERAKMLRGLVL
ncbi:MAG: aldolase [Hyphomicrobiaceae bacterium]|nr:MAG: aldolase [Hyphomicrobiaceae bacterium]